MLPERLLCARSRKMSASRDVKSGSVPVNLLKASLISRRFALFLRAPGMVPLSWFSSRSRLSRFEKFPQDSGIVPTRLLLSRRSVLMKGEFASDAGKVPSRLLWPSSKSWRVDMEPK